MAFELRRVRQDDLIVNHEINVTPFIDIILVLLIIFMIAVPISMVHMPLELPVSTQKSPSIEQAPVVLTVAADLSLEVNGRPVSPSGLAAALDAATRKDRGTRIFVRADRTIQYGDLIKVMDQLRAAGYLKVSLVARESEEPAS